MDTHHRTIDQLLPGTLDAHRDNARAENRPPVPAEHSQYKLDELDSAVEQARCVC